MEMGRQIDVSRRAATDATGALTFVARRRDEVALPPTRTQRFGSFRRTLCDNPLF